MYQQFNEQFAVATRQFADTAAQINRLALDNAQALFGLQLSALEERASATFAFMNEAVQARDIDSAKNLWPKGVQVARENFERAVSTGQEVLGRTVKTNEAIGEIAKSQMEVVARKAGNVAEQAQEQFNANVANVAKANKPGNVNANVHAK